MSMTITPQIRTVGNKLGQSVRKMALPLVAAGIITTGATSCGSSAQKDVEETQKTEKMDLKDLAIPATVALAAFGGGYAIGRTSGKIAGGLEALDYLKL